MDFGIAQTTLEFVTKVADKINSVRDFTNYYTPQSLSDFSKLTRVEPLTIVSKDCINLDYLVDIQSSLLNIFTAHYLQAINILTKVNSVEVIKTLDKLNPDRDSTGWLLAPAADKKYRGEMGLESISTLSLESYTHSLPIHGVALEQDGGDNKGVLQEVSNLSVGKYLTVDINVGVDKEGKTVSHKINVNVRLMTSIVPVNTIRGLLARTSEDLSFIERAHAVASGRIRFFKDFILAQDLIDEYKKNAIEDQTGTTQEILRRVANSKKYGLLTKNASLAAASNIFVMTSDNAREVESKLGGKLSNAAIRKKAFDNTYAMVIAIINREYETVTFYTRNVPTGMELTLKEIKNFSGKKGPDIADMMKAFTMGAPAF